MKFRPLHDRVLLKPLEAEEKTAGGIIIPDTAKEKPMQGEVVAVGPGARNEKGEIVPLEVKVGDRVLFGKWSGTEVKIGGDELLIVKESDVMGIIEGACVSACCPCAKPPNSGGISWQPKKLNFRPTRGTSCSAASTFSPTPSR